MAVHQYSVPPPQTSSAHIPYRNPRNPHSATHAVPVAQSVKSSHGQRGARLKMRSNEFVPRQLYLTYHSVLFLKTMVALVFLVPTLSTLKYRFRNIHTFDEDKWSQFVHLQPKFMCGVEQRLHCAGFASGQYIEIISNEVLSSASALHRRFIARTGPCSTSASCSLCSVRPTCPESVTGTFTGGSSEGGAALVGTRATSKYSAR